MLVFCNNTTQPFDSSLHPLRSKVAHQGSKVAHSGLAQEIGPVRATCAASIRAKCTASIHYTFFHPMSKAKLPTPVPQQSLVLRIASATILLQQIF